MHTHTYVCFDMFVVLHPTTCLRRNHTQQPSFGGTTLPRSRRGSGQLGPAAGRDGGGVHVTGVSLVPVPFEGECE